MAKSIIGFLIGFLVAELSITYTTFSLQKEIDIVEIFSLIVTTLLAVYVLRKLNKTDEGEKTERNLLINYITTFESDFTEIIRKISSGGLEYSNVVAVIKRHGMRIQHLIKLGEEQRLLKENSEMQRFFQKEISNIKELLTNTPKTGEIEDGIRLDKNNKLFFSQNQIDKIASALYQTRSLIFKLIVEINRCDRN